MGCAGYVFGMVCSTPGYYFCGKAKGGLTLGGQSWDIQWHGGSVQDLTALGCKFDCGFGGFIYYHMDCGRHNGIHMYGNAAGELPAIGRMKPVKAGSGDFKTACDTDRCT